jgi:GLPGLI family protein
MKKGYYLIILLYILPTITKAQEKNSSPHFNKGKVIYSAHITMHSPSTSVDTLKFNREKSIFLWQSAKNKKTNKFKRNHPSAKLIYSPYNNDLHRFNFYAVGKDSLYSQIYLLNQIYFLKEPVPNIHWKITDNTKKIGSYKVQKATAHFRGRNDTVWFTPQIPVPYGPWKLIGLPGLVLQAYDSKKNIYFTAQKVIFQNIGSIRSMPLKVKGKVINLEQYKNIMTHMQKDMVKNAHKIVRKYRQKNPDAKFNFKFPDQKPMEIFDDSAGD